jgi:GT2 family glycosyltransferase
MCGDSGTACAAALPDARDALPCAGARACSPCFRLLDTGALCARVWALRACGGFRAEFFAYVEDVELGLRFLRAGWTLLWVRQAPFPLVCQLVYLFICIN